MSSRRRLVTLSRSRVTHQAATFVGSNVGMKVMTALATVIVARAMTVHRFGAFSFSVSFLLFVAMVFEFGFFLPAARLAATAEPEERHRLFGAALAVFVPVGAGCTAAIYGLSFLVD